MCEWLYNVISSLFAKIIEIFNNFHIQTKIFIEKVELEKTIHTYVAKISV